MKNKEKYAKEIVDSAIYGQGFGFDKRSKKIVRCSAQECAYCLFHDDKPCSLTREEWANAEYKEPKRFTEREKLFIKLFPSIQYIARDKIGVLYVFMSKPEKTSRAWLSIDEFVWEIESYMKLDFLSIQWEDEEPTTREEILRGSDE